MQGGEREGNGFGEHTTSLQHIPAVPGERSTHPADHQRDGLF